jgi:hypothetical protein
VKRHEFTTLLGGAAVAHATWAVAALKMLAANHCHIGVRSTIDVHGRYL